MAASSEVDLPLSTKEVHLLIASKEYSSAVKNINKYLKLWPLEQDFYISKAFCELKMHKYHSCLATIATYHGQSYKPKNNNENRIPVAKEHIVNGVCKWMHLEQGLALYKLGKYNLALQALFLCRSNLPALSITREINLQNIKCSESVVDDFLDPFSNLAATEHPKYLHLLAQILFKLEKYDKSIAIYNHLMTKNKDQDVLTTNLLASYLMDHDHSIADDKYNLMESILQRHLDYKGVKNFELAFNSSLVQSYGGRSSDSLNYLEIAEGFIEGDSFVENLEKSEILASKAQRSYLKMSSRDIEAEDYNKIFLGYISSNPPITPILIKVATNILVYTRNIKIKREMLSYLIKIGKLELTSYEMEIFNKNILTSMLQLGMINEYQVLLSGVKAKYPNHSNLTVYIASLYYAQNRVQKCEQILINNLGIDNQKEVLALMSLYYLQKKFTKVLSLYNTFKTLYGDYLHKSVLIVLKSIKEICATSTGKWVNDIDTIFNEYNQLCQSQSISPSGTNLLIIAMLYLKCNMHENASNIYKRILFGSEKYEKLVLDQAASGLAFSESFTDDYKLWSFDLDDGKRYNLVTRFQQNIYDKIKYIESENLESEGVYIRSCKITTNVEVKRGGKNRKRSRISKMDPAILAKGPPDPERWLPKHERSGFKKSKKKKKEDLLSKATQGSTASPTPPKPTTANISTAPSNQKRKKRR